MKNKRLRFKKRRHISSDDFHSARLRKIMQYQLKRAFPNKKERLEYMKKLYEGLE